MRPPVDTRDPAAVESDVQASYVAIFPDADRSFVPRAFSWATQCFAGQYRDYLPIDARYHDFEHTLQGTLCMMRLLHGRHLAAAQPAVPRRLFELGLLAILLHDTGYLKKKGDDEGSGAKYTPIHVHRSADFAAELLAENRYGAKDILSVQNMIHCTGVNLDLSTIPFQDNLERLVGFALGTGDLLGQMAAPDYLEKLPILYEEFAESHRYNGGCVPSSMIFASAEDLLRQTPVFWEKYVKKKMQHEFEGLFVFLSDSPPDGPNIYLHLIQANIDRLKARFDAAA